MRQLSTLGALALAILFWTSGCGEATTKNTSTTVPSSSTDPNALRMLTTREIPRQRELYAGFTAQTNIPIAMSVVSPAELARLVAAGELAGKTDVVIAHAMEYLLPLQASGVFQPFFTDGMSAGQIPSRYIDNEGYWTMLSRWTMAAVYDPRRNMREQVATYPALASLPMRNKLLLAHPDSSGFPALIAGLTALYNPSMQEIFPPLIGDNLAAPATGSDAGQLDALARDPGKVAFVGSANYLLWRYSGDPNRFQASEEWRIAYPVDADRRNIENGTVLSLVNETPRREAALLFIDFLLSESVQQEWSVISMEYPVNVYAIANDFLMGIEDLPGGDYAAEAIDNQLPAVLPAARAALLSR